MDTAGLIAGRGNYPFEWVAGARRAGIKRIVVAAFEGETDPALAEKVESIAWMRVGQLGKLIHFFQQSGIQRAVMAGQIRPGNLFDLKPDFKALLLLARLKKRNAETLFGGIADELTQAGIELMPATTFMEDQLATEGWSIGPRPKPRLLEDVRYGFEIAKEISRLDIGQTVVVKNGTVLAVEGFEGTNDALRRGGALGRRGVIAVKVSKPNQDLRFDVPVIGQQTLEIAAEAGVILLAVEPGKTLLLEKEKLNALASHLRMTVMSVGCGSS